MINSVRNTVMNILNKTNNGYITPDQFNSFAKQAQLQIFIQYVEDLRKSKQFDRKNGETSGYSDKTNQLDQALDFFSKNTILTYNVGTQKFDMPDGWYYLNVLYYNGNEVTHVDQGKLNYLLKSNLTAPSTMYPSYVLQGDSIKVYPTTIINNVEAYYLRYPKDPKWTYTNVGNSPLFNQAASDYQDFELTDADFTKIVLNICQLAGLSIRESEVIQFATQDEMYNDQKQSQ